MPGASRLEALRVLLSVPQSIIWVGTVSTVTLVPIVTVGAAPYFVNDVQIWVGTTLAPHATNYWKLEVERVVLGSSSKIDVPFSTVSYGLRAASWLPLVSSVGIVQNETVAVRLTPVGSPTALVGVAFAYSLEVR